MKRHRQMDVFEWSMNIACALWVIWCGLQIAIVIIGETG